MDYRMVVRRTAGDLSGDLSMDPTMQDAKDPGTRGLNVTPSPETDGGDPATSGGASPYNGAPPFGSPATSDPEWLDPQTQIDQPDRRPVPFIQGPNQMQQTLRSNAATAARGDIVDLWTEASADVEADAAALRMSRAKVSVASLWPFLAMARSEREFNHRLALTAARIEEKVETDLFEPVLASLRADFLVLAAGDPDGRPTDREDLIGHELQEHPLGGQQIPWGGVPQEHEEEVHEPAARRAISPVKDEHYSGGPWTEDYKPDEHSYNLRSMNSLEYFHAGLGRWVAAEDEATAGLGNPSYFVGGPEAGPNTSSTGQFAPHPTGADPFSPINQMYPAQPQPWTVTPGTEWREQPMNFDPPGGGNHPYKTAADIGDQDTCKTCGQPTKYVKTSDGDRFWSHTGPDGWQYDDHHEPLPNRYSKQGAAAPFAAQTANPAYFAGGPEGVTGPEGAQFPEEPSEDPTSEAVNFYGQVPPQMSSGSGRTAAVEHSGPENKVTPEFSSPQERARYEALQNGDDPGDRASFSARRTAVFFDPYDPGVRMVTAADSNTPQGSPPPENTGTSDPGAAGGAPEAPPSMMGGPGSTAGTPMTTSPRQLPSGGGGGMPPGDDPSGMPPAMARRFYALESYERPSDRDPTGAGDEFLHNTWGNEIKTRPRQGPEDRAVNTPQQPGEPIPTVSSEAPAGGGEEERREASLVASRIVRELVGA